MVSNNLKLVRTNLKLSKTELSKKSKVSRMTIFKIEKGFDNPKKKTMDALAKALNSTVDYIFFDTSGNLDLQNEEEVK